LFFEKINKIDRPLANQTKMRREKIQINKIRNAKGETITNTTEIQEINRDYFRTYILINLKILKKWTNY
jgi:ribosomal protein L20A (L18A)